MMKTYRTFEEYMYDNYYDAIYNKVNGFLFQKKSTSFLSTTLIPDVSRFELDDYHVMGATFNTPGDDALHFRLSINADVNVYGRSRYDYESDTKSVWISVYCESILKNGLHHVRIVRVEEYSKDRFDKETALDHYLVPYLYSEDADKVAEDFLREYCPQALEVPMPLPINEIVKKMGMLLYPAPLENNIFGKTYFVTSTVTVYKDSSYCETADITIPPGTMLVNPIVFFMYNIGTMNNTIIHECVHWKRHRMFFELMRLLNNDCCSISCETIEGYGRGKENSSPLDWIEWQANYLAPKILMPAATTKKYIQDRMHDLRQSMPSAREAEVLEQALVDTKQFFNVSLLAAKIRAIELGIEQAQGLFVFIEGRYLPPFSFSSLVVGKSGTFVIDTISAMCTLMVNPELKQLYQEDKLIFVNNMFCINTPKYIQIDDDGHRKMTDYALDHIDECCFLFTQKKRISHYYDDSYYRVCFLCREYSSDSVNETQLSAEERNKTMQSLLENIDTVMGDNAKVVSIFSELPSTFPATLKYHMKRLDFTNDSLAGATQLSSQTISTWKNHPYDKNNGIETLLKLFVGMHLAPDFCFDMMRKAGVSFNLDNPKEQFLYMMVRDQTRLNICDWQTIFDQAGINVKIYDSCKPCECPICSKC